MLSRSVRGSTVAHGRGDVCLPSLGWLGHLSLIQLFLRSAKPLLVSEARQYTTYCVICRKHHICARSLLYMIVKQIHITLGISSTRLFCHHNSPIPPAIVGVPNHFCQSMRGPKHQWLKTFEFFVQMKFALSARPCYCISLGSRLDHCSKIHALDDVTTQCHPLRNTCSMKKFQLKEFTQLPKYLWTWLM